MQSVIFNMCDWIQEHIQCIARPIEDMVPPYSVEQLQKLQIPCGQLKVLYDFVEKFELPIDYEILDKYERFSNLTF